MEPSVSFCIFHLSSYVSVVGLYGEKNQDPLPNPQHYHCFYSKSTWGEIKTPCNMTGNSSKKYVIQEY